MYLNYVKVDFCKKKTTALFAKRAVEISPPRVNKKKKKNVGGPKYFYTSLRNIFFFHSKMVYQITTMRFSCCISICVSKML